MPVRSIHRLAEPRHHVRELPAAPQRKGETEDHHAEGEIPHIESQLLVDDAAEEIRKASVLDKEAFAADPAVQKINRRVDTSARVSDSRAGWQRDGEEITVRAPAVPEP